MAFCSHCGAMIADDANFCSHCGAQVATAAYTGTSAMTTGAVTMQVYSGEGYAVMLLDCGSCTATAAANLLSDACGYTDAEAMMFVSNAPTLVAQALTKDQAVYLAQSMTEYGMEAAIYDRNGNQTFSSEIDTVYDDSGSFLTNVAASLGLIGLANRITGTIRRLTLPQRPPVYTLRRPASRPPVRRHTIIRQSAPPHQPMHTPAPHAARPAHPMTQARRVNRPAGQPQGSHSAQQPRSQGGQSGPGGQHGGNNPGGPGGQHGAPGRR